MKLADTIINGKLSSPKFKIFKMGDEWDILKSSHLSSFCRSDIEIAYCYINNITSIPKCSCGNNLKFYNYPKGYSISCGSSYCRNNHPDRIKKIKETKFFKYGNSGFNNTKKRKETNLKKYGKEHGFQSEQIKQKTKETLLTLYGVEHVSQIDFVKEKKANISFEIRSASSKKAQNTRRTNNPSSFDIISNEDLVTLYKKYTTVQISEMFGIAHSTVGNKLKSLGMDLTLWTSVSGIENEVSHYIKSLGVDVINSNRKVIYPYELDIYIPEKNIAIELNGIFWHSIKSIEDNTVKNIHKHQTKSNLCIDKNIQLIQITDTSWKNKTNIWKSVLKQKLGIIENKIFARNCVIKNVSSSLGTKFVEENHIQGKLNRGKYVGLYYKDELVSIIQYDISRFSKAYDWEILRFCSKLNTSVIGGFSKLLKHIDLKGLIVSYANRDWSIGKVYEKNGFELKSITQPNYWYWKDNEILHNRLKFQKHKLKEILPIFDNNLTEFENMVLNGYKKYCDSGNLVYVLDNLPK